VRVAANIWLSQKIRIRIPIHILIRSTAFPNHKCNAEWDYTALEQLLEMVTVYK